MEQLFLFSFKETTYKYILRYVHKYVHEYFQIYRLSGANKNTSHYCELSRTTFSMVSSRDTSRCF